MERVIEIEVTQFMRPSGRQRIMRTTVPEKCLGSYELMKKVGARLTAEELHTNEISLTIEDPKHGDVTCCIVQNGPKVQETLGFMLQDFTEEKYQSWKKLVTAD